MLERLFTWWNGATFGTAFTLFRRGAKQVGVDDQGNRYFTEDRPSGAQGRQRRWVVYHGVAEASRVPPDWRGWLHHTVDEPPGDVAVERRVWEKDHRPNMTGTPLAYRPDGSLAQPDAGAGVGRDYEAWSPEDA